MYDNLFCFLFKYAIELWMITNHVPKLKCLGTLLTKIFAFYAFGEGPALPMYQSALQAPAVNVSIHVRTYLFVYVGVFSPFSFTNITADNFEWSEFDELFSPFS